LTTFLASNLLDAREAVAELAVQARIKGLEMPGEPRL
jgi:hypothetical protein